MSGSAGRWNGLAVACHTPREQHKNTQSPATHLTLTSLKPVDFRGVVHVAEPSLLVDEALGFTWLRRPEMLSPPLENTLIAWAFHS